MTTEKIIIDKDTYNSLLTQLSMLEESAAFIRNTMKGVELSVDNNVFDNIEDALDFAEDILRDQAAEDCEGAYNCGMDSYDMEVKVADKIYVVRLNVEYNRHDKTYYYIDGTNLEHWEKDQ